MAKRNVEFKVGILIIIGIIILGGSLYWLEGHRLRMNAHMIDVRFDDVGALAVGDKVTVSGVYKGKVNALTLSDRGVLVQVQLQREVTLNSDATFTIKNMGVMGERFIAIDPGTDTTELNYDRVIEGDYDPGLPEVMGLMGEMITELRQLVGSVKRTIGSDSTLSLFNETLSNMEQLSSSLMAYVERNEGKLDTTAENLVVASNRFNELLQENSGKIDSTFTRFNRTSVKVEEIVAVLDTVSTSARAFARRLDNPDGSLQLLMEDRRLYDDLRRTADNVDDLINDIRANPRKYINFTLEIF
jgi:phospholipid/cholesterol/gamma-HCH transport system substrate-binding protein